MLKLTKSSAKANIPGGILNIRSDLQVKLISPFVDRFLSIWPKVYLKLLINENAYCTVTQSVYISKPQLQFILIQDGCSYIHENVTKSCQPGIGTYYKWFCGFFWHIWSCLIVVANNSFIGRKSLKDKSFCIAHLDMHLEKCEITDALGKSLFIETNKSRVKQTEA